MKTFALGFTFLLASITLAGCLGGSEPYFDNASPVRYYFSEQCVHCVRMKPILRELAQEGFRVKPMDVGANPSLWQDIPNAGTPTWLADNGDRLTGEKSKETLKKWLESHGAKIK